MAKAKRQPPRKPKAKRGVSYTRVQEIAREFPGVEDSTSYGTPALKVRGTLLARLKEDDETLVLKTTFTDRELLLGGAPDVFISDRSLPQVPLDSRAAAGDRRVLPP